MTPIRKFLRAIRIEEWLAFISAIIVTTINTVLYQNAFSIIGTARSLLRYFSFGDPYYKLFFISIYLFYIWKFYIYIAKIMADRFVHKKPFPKESLRTALRYLFEPVRIVLPFIVIAVPFYALLGNLDYTLRFSGKDSLFLYLDKAITGIIPFVYLPTAMPSLIWSWILKYSYYSLAFLMGIVMGIFFFRKKTYRLFRHVLIAFILSLIISFPIWAALPCQDPSEYFIRNLRGYTFPTNVTQILSAYHPSEAARATVESIDTAETSADTYKTVPISCFPSMHAVWAIFVIYFLAVAWRKTLFVSIPWVILLLIGGVYYAQHYVIDYVVAIPVAVICIALSYWFLNLEKRWKK